MKELNGGLWLSKEELNAFARWIWSEEKGCNNTNTINQMIVFMNKENGTSVGLQEMQTVREMLKCTRNDVLTPFFDLLISILECERSKWEAITGEVADAAVVERPNKGDDSRQTG
jgi:hypothetical protein